MTKPIVIIPARGGSKRIPHKNIADVNGEPMISYPIKVALASKIFSEVLVSTDSDQISEIARAYGASVIERPDHLATDTAFEIDAYKDFFINNATTEQLSSGLFCAIYPTAIFITEDDLKTSHKLIAEDSKTDALMSVSTYQIHPFKALEHDTDGYAQMVYPEHCLERSQTYPHYVASNGTFYWLRLSAFLSSEKPTYYLPRLRTYEIPHERAVDIDEPQDLNLARALMASRSGS